MRILTFSPIFLSNPPQAEVLQSWLEWQQMRNQEADILLIDNNSPQNFLGLVPQLRHVPRIVVAEGGTLPPLQKGINLIAFPDNIGTLALTGRDGWGRALSRAAQMALDNNYDFLASISYDIFFPHAVRDMTGMMAHFRLGCLSAMRARPFGMETGLFFMDCAALRARDFCRHYRWQDIVPPLKAEQVCEKILDPFYKSWFYATDEKNHVDVAQIRPQHTIIRAHNVRLYETFMRHYAPDWVWPAWRA